ncbi:MAG TPA: hypothetical protein VG890_11345 [Puia sp.]|nr:hypothetical protein [Puia sp.]
MKIILTISFLALMFASYGQNSKAVDNDEQQLDAVCDTIMQYFSKGQFKDAIQLVKQNSVIEPEKIDTLLVAIENQAQNYFPAYGKMLSAEFITSRKLKNFIEKRFYIVKFEKFPLKADFTLYKSSRGWTITSFNYNEDLMELLF